MRPAEGDPQRSFSFRFLECDQNSTWWKWPRAINALEFTSLCWSHARPNVNTGRFATVADPGHRGPNGRECKAKVGLLVSQKAQCQACIVSSPRIASRLARGLEAIAIRLEAIAIRLETIAGSLEAIAIGLEAIASRLEAIASSLEAIAIMLEAIGSRLEAIPSRLETVAIRLEAVASSLEPSLLG